MQNNRIGLPGVDLPPAGTDRFSVARNAFLLYPPKPNVGARIYEYTLWASPFSHARRRKGSPSGKRDRVPRKGPSLPSLDFRIHGNEP